MNLKKILIVTVILMTLFVTVIYADDINEEAPASSIFEDLTVETYKSEGLNINARSAIVMDFESGRVLFEKNAYQKRPMASTTKVMTAIVAIENGNLDDMVTVSKNAASIHGSLMHLKAGETLTLRELLYGLLLCSGNDAAIAIAEHVGGSMENFIKMMNEKAKEIGAFDTNFTTPHGLDEVGHYSTAYDLALITRYALRIPLFNEIVKTTSIQIGGRYLQNTNEMLTSYPGADGVKTGYTGKAGRCLITSATRDGRRFISVVLYCDSRAQRALSSKKILDYAFSLYYPRTVIKSEYLGTLPVIKGFEKTVPVYVEKTVTMPLSDAEMENLYTKISLPEQIYAPVTEKAVVGTLSVYLDDQILCESPIRAGKSVKQKTILQYFIDVVISWLKLIK
ncbi:D-alanyl-D-alanine carboxypeptidase family protein [Thermoclostridium stercorarium]|uniref:D-alanyl-D-alanine carboxypeptidase family protein n=1 Tax=Thermoclostridium stercorarium TaxID=1510 RepID=UPI001F2D74B9|nr:D-alanyl-D-alanine carboxypeptidase family protein [Thermoclostridium stercorarium]